MTYMKLLLIASFSYKEVVLVGVVKSLVYCRHYFEEGYIQSNNTWNEISLATYTFLRSSYIKLLAEDTLLANAKY
jgi:Ni/Fe-hydrogenase subunit HybB-like protein